MSKIGRKPISLENVQVEVKGQEIHYKGKTISGVYVLPDILEAEVLEKKLLVKANNKKTKESRDLNRIWGLHRALLFNALYGASKGFEKNIEINGLGYKAALSGNKVVFTLGYSHKIDFDLPKGVSLEIDKTGQKLTFKSADKELVGHICSLVRSLRPPEPYKGTGIKFATEVIARKAGKAKASA